MEMRIDIKPYSTEGKEASIVHQATEMNLNERMMGAHRKAATMDQR